MKTRKIILVMLIMLLAGITNAYAAETKVTAGVKVMTGEKLIAEAEETAKVGETKTVVVKIQTEEEIGMISGKIKVEGNITIEGVTAKNSWNLTYNDQAGENKGKFNMLKPVGAKTEEILEIKYKAGAEGTGKITLEGIKLTNINFQMEEIANIVKEIKIEEGLKVEIKANAKYEIKEAEGKLYIENIAPKTAIKTLIESIETNGAIKVYKGETEITDKDANIATGEVLKASKGTEEKEYKIVVIGDLNGDGQMNDIDLLMLARYKAKLYQGLTGEYLRASEIVKNGTYADDMDMLKMARILVGLDSI